MLGDQCDALDPFYAKNLSELVARHTDIVDCWIVINDKTITAVCADGGRDRHLTPRAVRALMLEMPTLRQRDRHGLVVDGPGVVEIRFNENVVMVFESGSSLMAVELPQGSNSRKSLLRSATRILRGPRTTRATLARVPSPSAPPCDTATAPDEDTP